MARIFAQPKQSDSVSTIGPPRAQNIENPVELNYNSVNTNPTTNNSNVGGNNSGGIVKNNVGIVSQLIASNSPVVNPKKAMGKYTDRIFRQGRR